MGIVQQSQSPKANQEIVLQFLENQSTEENHKSLEEISETLEQIGADAITVSSDNGLYRITYHSNSATSTIKKLLLKTSNISFEDDSTSNKKENKSYAFDVFNIEKGTSTSWDLDATVVYTLNFKSDRSFNPDVFKFPVLVEAGKISFNYKIAYNVSRAVTFVSDNTSYNIPEVRAGPTS